MRRVVFDVEAERALLDQIDYLISRDAVQAAVELDERVRSFLTGSLASFPAIGRPVGHRDLWETWVPRTRLVVWYRFDETTVEVVAVWSTWQKRPRS